MNTVNHIQADVNLTDHILYGIGGWYIAMLLQLRSVQGYQGFPETKMANGGTISLAVLNLCVRFKIRVAPFDTNPSVTDSTQSITAPVQKLPDSTVKSVR